MADTTGKLRTRVACLVAFAIAAVPAEAGRWWFGGGIGLGFGDVTYVSVEPIVGYATTPRLDVGARAIYRYRDDERYSPSLSTSDYGASLFGRYHVRQPVFLQLEYEHLSYELLFVDGSTERDEFDSVLAGPGLLQPLGDRSGFFVLALYNFSYEDDEPSPYSDAWIFRVGVGFSF